MRFEEALIRSIRAYYKGMEPDNFYKTNKEVKYTREFFDNLEESILKDPPKELESDMITEKLGTDKEKKSRNNNNNKKKESKRGILSYEPKPS